MIDNVTINGLLPGPFDTDRLRGPVPKLDAEKRGMTVDQLLAERASNPAGRFGDPEEFGAGLRVSLRRQGRLHHRPEHPARRRRISRGRSEPSDLERSDLERRQSGMKAVWYE